MDGIKEEFLGIFQNELNMINEKNQKKQKKHLKKERQQKIYNELNFEILEKDIQNINQIIKTFTSETCYRKV